MLTWTSLTYPDHVWPEELAKLWKTSIRHFPNTDQIDPVWGAGKTWYFWDETWGDACGPFSSEAEARVGIQAYIATL